MRGMVVGEGGRSSGVLLYRYIHFHSQMQIRFFSDGQVHIRASLYLKFSITNTYLTPSMVIVVVADSVTL